MYHKNTTPEREGGTQLELCKIVTNTLTQPENTYWHFLDDARTLRYGDGRRVVAGETLTATGKPVLCENGMHGSARAIDALGFAPGPVACLVTLGGEIVHDTDKSVGQTRMALWVYDASHLLREFACDVAEGALLAERAAGREPDSRSFAAIEVMRRFMRGEASEKERSAAYLAAYSAAESAASLVAYLAADSAAYSAADSAAYSAAYSVACSAACSAADSAACSAADSAAYSVAYSAACSAADSAYNERLTQMLLGARVAGEGEFAPATSAKEGAQA